MTSTADHAPAQTGRPRVGMLATVRTRRALVTAVDPFDGGPDGTLHLVTVEYTEPDGPPDDTLIWEREPGATVLEPSALPRVGDAPPMAPREFEALVRATRWSALSPYIDPDAEGPLARLPVSAPLHGAVQVEDYQLVPLQMALRMPRISLLLADDVGLGKTIEAGLILTELLLRRRVRRVLILCPASLRRQWRSEMAVRFSLPFDIVDRAETEALHRRAGLDANPWRSFPRIITSYHYLRQPDVLESLRAASRAPAESPMPPWDLLIVDEAHNLAPAAIGEDSDLCQMLGAISPLFEHRLFLTATPHNGYTRSFSGLLELLDPVRFTRTSEFSPNERARVQDVVVRRLKRDLNAAITPPPFCSREVLELPVTLSPEERALSNAAQDLRLRIRSLVAARRRGEQLAGSFAVEVLSKRLLSCPFAFATSWWRYTAGLESPDDEIALSEVDAARRAAGDETDDDREAEGRTAHAVATVGAWLRPMAAAIETERAAVEAAVDRLRLGRGVNLNTAIPKRDGRWDALLEWLDGHLRPRGRWRDDERLVLFTEYKTTLDYLARRLTTECGADRILQLYGGMDDIVREAVKAGFNDPAHPVRVLVATDAASEGLNLQETARYLIHWDIPWNPSRLEQRNGRLDRHGQARDVTIWHFTSHDDADMSFMAYVARKVDRVREDLGSTGEVFDAAVQRRLITGDEVERVQKGLDADIDRTRGRADYTATVAAVPDSRLEALRAEIDLDATTLRDTLEVALASGGAGLPRFDGVDARGRCNLRQPIPIRWQDLIDDTLRLPARGGALGPLPSLVFDPSAFMDGHGGRPVFRQPPDTRLLHLGHPVFHRTLGVFARARFPGGEGTASRWTVRRDQLPDVFDALILLTVEELAVNELRETFHHWVRTIRLPIREGRLEEPLRHVPARQLGTGQPALREDADQALDLWDGVVGEIRDVVRAREADLREALTSLLAEQQGRALDEERRRYQTRLQEISRAMNESTLSRLEREIEELGGKMALFGEEQQRLDRIRLEKEEELTRRRTHYVELRDQLGRERERIIRLVIPRRHSLRGEDAVRVFPVAVEIRLPAGSEA
jgi:superfamily II DNA or RNA helicase